ncbi:hypothetical protein F7725_024279 [Dissostichus mawsoni]|uniref:Uncharacterized protein n=1 Tax=Dissostichus mawsoni TaxID=36200 RepID=A0A7J5Y1U6_DISMA|nr:hypothetical protein F7725_024279 [Dissostichus mawsoni]
MRAAKLLTEKKDFTTEQKCSLREGFLELNCFVVLVHANQETQAAHRDPLLHAEQLELITVLPALQRQRILRHLHHCVLPQSSSLLVKQGVGLA